MANVISHKSPSKEEVQQLIEEAGIKGKSDEIPGLSWTTASSIERWNKELFKNQAHTMIELAGLLMTADLKLISPG